MIDTSCFVFENVMFSYLMLSIVAISFLVFIIYNINFLKVTFHKNRNITEEEYEPTTIVIVIVDEIDYLKDKFNMLLNQDYPKDYQVVVVNYRPETAEVGSYLEFLKEQHGGRLYVTTIKKEGIIAHTRKLAYTIGIKAAIYNNIVFSDPKVEVTSNRWLRSMSRSFKNDESLVLGYVDIKEKEGSLNKLFRTINLHDSLMWLSLACQNNVYRASILNLGMTSKLFFKSGGYRERLRLNSGESDLFVQKFARYGVTEVVLTPSSTVSKNLEEYSFSRWYNNQIFDFYTTKFYNIKHKLYLTLEPIFSLLFLVGSIFTLIINISLWYYIFTMFVIRFILNYILLIRFSKKVGINTSIAFYFMYDIFGVFYKAILFISRKFSSSCDLWIRIK